MENTQKRRFLVIIAGIALLGLLVGGGVAGWFYYQKQQQTIKTCQTYKLDAYHPTETKACGYTFEAGSFNWVVGQYIKIENEGNKVYIYINVNQKKLKKVLLADLSYSNVSTMGTIAIKEPFLNFDNSNVIERKILDPKQAVDFFKDKTGQVMLFGTEASGQIRQINYYLQK